MFAFKRRFESCVWPGLSGRMPTSMPSTMPFLLRSRWWRCSPPAHCCCSMRPSRWQCWSTCWAACGGTWCASCRHFAACLWLPLAAKFGLPAVEPGAPCCTYKPADGQTVGFRLSSAMGLHQPLPSALHGRCIQTHRYWPSQCRPSPKESTAHGRPQTVSGQHRGAHAGMPPDPRALLQLAANAAQLANRPR